MRMLVESPSHVVGLVSRIQVPPHASFCGEFPILSILCGTDNVNIVCETLKAFTDEEWCGMWDVIKYCLSDTMYPHEITVWPYNSPQVAMDRCKAASEPGDKLCEAAREETIRYILTHETTFPFIDTHLTTMDETELQPRLRENSYADADTSEIRLPYLIPTLALGSLVLLTRSARTEDTI